MYTFIFLFSFDNISNRNPQMQILYLFTTKCYMRSGTLVEQDTDNNVI